MTSTTEMDAITQEVPAVRHAMPRRPRPSWRERFYAALTLFLLLLCPCLVLLGWFIWRDLLGGHL